ncbi:MAG: Ada metal-binding domain-containing protein, partial [Natronospirillum sp.]
MIESVSESAQALPERRWAAVQARDWRADGAFVYAVRTTGVYCRPSCPSRQAKRAHVAFYDTPDAAEQAGFRACMRCQPTGVTLPARRAATVEALCRFIDRADDLPSAAALAAVASWSVSHMQRTFKALVGVTPRAYAAAQRTQRLRSGLGQAVSVTDAV